MKISFRATSLEDITEHLGTEFVGRNAHATDGLPRSSREAYVLGYVRAIGDVRELLERTKIEPGSGSK
jgi:hypothetical protein